MKKDFFEIVMILDRSGSMGHLQTDTIGSCNKFIKEQKALPGTARLTLMVFDTDRKFLIEGANLANVSDDFLNKNNYYPDGNTALYTAVCEAMDKVGRRLAETPEAERPEQVICVIVTDGEENSSHMTEPPYTFLDTQKRIKTQTEAYNWKIMYLGTDIMQMKHAANLGIAPQSMLKYTPDTKGVQALYCATSDAVRSIRGHALSGTNLADYQTKSNP